MKKPADTARETEAIHANEHEQKEEGEGQMRDETEREGRKECLCD